MAKGSRSYQEYNQLLGDIAAGKLEPVYLLQGDEFFFLETLLEKIEEKAVDPATAGFNKHSFYGKDTDIYNLISAARRYPMMADRQLVILKEAQDLKQSDEIISYLENPVPSTVLVWYHPGKKIPMNRKLGAAFKSHRVFSADALKESEVPEVVKKYLNEKGYDIEPGSLQILMEYNSYKLSGIIRELEKVFANLNPGSKIRESHIEEFVGINKEYSVFALQSALASRNKKKTLEIAAYLKSNVAANPLPLLLAILFSYFRKVAILQSIRGKTEKEILSILGVQFFAINDYKTAARNYNAQQIQAVIHILCDADLKFKGIVENAGNEAELMEETILRILSVD